MSKISIKLPDNSVREFDQAPTVLELAKSISPKLAKDTYGAIINDSKDVQDLRTTLNDGDTVRIITSKDEESLEVVRHSAAHVMAQAVQDLWPDVKVTIGPVIDNGFYYDFDTEMKFSPEDLTKIEKQINSLLKKNYEVTREDWPKEKAIETFKKMGERFKVEIIEDLDEKEVGIYHQGPWFDLCRGPHVQKLSQIKAVKLLSVAGAYWRGDENNASLQRIYATAFNSKEDLAEHLKNLEEAKKRDHRRLGKELGLFTFHEYSPGNPFFAPAGATIYRELMNLMKEKYVEYGYEEVITPQMVDINLYHQSGHYENYKENLYFTKVDERDFAVKPMNCPGHCLLYSSELRSYRDMPWRVADFGRLHRNERSGTMHGLTRVRSFCQDDAHIFCRLDQVQDEIESFMKFLNEVYTTLGMNNYKIFFSTRPEKRIGSDEQWDKAEGALENALKTLGMDFTINEGDGAFYGPKLDIMFVDSMKRPWQLGTLQADFTLPEAFNLKFVNEENDDERPVMLHRAILGSLERFIGVYLEHTAGRLPTWLSPIQVRILNVTSASLDYCVHLEKQFKEAGIRVKLDDRNEKLGKKIREGQLQRVPYLMIIGDKEKDENTVSARLGNGQNVNDLTLDQFLSGIQSEIEERKLKSPWWDDNFKS